MCLELFIRTISNRHNEPISQNVIISQKQETNARKPNENQSIIIEEQIKTEL